ncbi:MAG: tetratricopeptide repeat protein [Planctomycetota bacterium]|jgi:tetratricopeptide (TPR) repeat protein
MAVADLKNKARDAFRRKRYDLSVEMYLEALRFDASDAETVEGFFQAAKKARETKGKSLFGGMLSKVSLGSSRDPLKRMASCFRGLAKNPENKALLLALGEAAGDAGADETAISAYKHATEVDDQDAEAWKRLGEFQGRRGRIQEAIDALGRAVELRPRDQEAIKLRKNLAAEGALKLSGFETAKSSRELIKDKDAVRELEMESRMQLTKEHATSEIEKARQEIEREPTNSRLHVRLGDLILQTGDDDAAVASFEEALRLDPRNFDLAVRIGDMRLRKLEGVLKRARKALEATPDDAEKKAAGEAAFQAFLEARLEEYGRRVQEHPLDLAERFRLGHALLEAGRVDEAAAEFQQTVRDPNRKTESLLMLAECFEKKKLIGLAVKKLEEALGEFPSLTSPRSKEVHYAYADLLERKGDKQKARDVFEQIYEVDITYRDVSQRLDALTEAEA